MLVRLLVELSGTRNGEQWPKLGQVMDLPDTEAMHMLNAGMVVAVSEASEVVETAAVSVPAETRPAPEKARKRRSTKPEADPVEVAMDEARAVVDAALAG
jgi:hypothetical protein